MLRSRGPRVNQSLQSSLRLGMSQFGPPSNALFWLKIQAKSLFLLLVHLVDGNIHQKEVPLMKLFPLFFVLESEDNGKLNVAENEHDNDNHEAPAPRRRPAEPLAGANCRPAHAASVRGALAARSAAARFL